jgi:AraC-like DNA-binding protein
LLTARASIDSKVEGLETGADDYLTKPFDVRELEVRVENLIAARQRLKAFYAAPDAAGTSLAAESEPTSEGEAFAARVREVVEARLAEDDFGVEALAAAMGMGRTRLYEQMREVLDQSPMDLVWTMRLERAASLLRERRGTVAEVAYGVGFKSVAHFSTRFREAYGTTPTAYAA